MSDIHVTAQAQLPDWAVGPLAKPKEITTLTEAEERHVKRVADAIANKGAKLTVQAAMDTLALRAGMSTLVQSSIVTFGVFPTDKFSLHILVAHLMPGDPFDLAYTWDGMELYQAVREIVLAWKGKRISSYSM